ncbi:acyl-CoA thioesterase [Aromatoleum toluolicum]|uniref:4-hydroxybenzoyl-CoA thioesterase n=2 Tax=Aromatoleum TaxID=551759 RepID=A0A1N6PJG4_9RHOO|nr:MULTISPECIES: thioesterase family protein [Aromatoleum]NMF97914.2 acyl-CoA thioesterase [Aromatoleum toluolicum]SIQ04495.1 4-hydroxybenzoyl-CoA thioesterase [Aromatoleum tolulyticum]
MTDLSNAIAFVGDVGAKASAPARPAMFEREVLVRFAHCDPAGIVFYPQYFVLLNGLVEDWLTDGLGTSFADMIMRRRLGIPTVRMDCTFTRPSTLGDTLVLGLTVTRIGGRSIGLDVQGRVGEELRLRARQTLVTLDLETMKSVPIPADIRDRLGRYCQPVPEIAPESLSMPADGIRRETDGGKHAD